MAAAGLKETTVLSSQICKGRRSPFGDLMPRNET
jgi:hypothetical protein